MQQMFSFNNNNNNSQPSPALSPGAAGLSALQSRFKKAPPSSTRTEPHVQTPSSTMGSTPSSTTSPTNAQQGDHNWGVSGSTAGNLDPEANHQGAFGAGNNAHIGIGSKNPTFGTFTADQQPMMSDATPASGLFQNRGARADVSPHLPAGDGTSHTSSTAPQKLHVAAITPKDKASAYGPAWNSPFSQGDEQPEDWPQGGQLPSS